jgi:hypothetical protein
LFKVPLCGPYSQMTGFHSVYCQHVVWFFNWTAYWISAGEFLNLWNFTTSIILNRSLRRLEAHFFCVKGFSMTECTQGLTDSWAHNSWFFNSQTVNCYLFKTLLLTVTQLKSNYQSLSLFNCNIIYPTQLLTCVYSSRTLTYILCLSTLISWTFENSSLWENYFWTLLIQFSYLLTLLLTADNHYFYNFQVLAFSQLSQLYCYLTFTIAKLSSQLLLFTRLLLFSLVCKLFYSIWGFIHFHIVIHNSFNFFLCSCQINLQLYQFNFTSTCVLHLVPVVKVSCFELQDCN